MRWACYPTEVYFSPEPPLKHHAMMEPFPTIETNRLVLQQLRADDVPQVVEYAANKRISDFTLNIPFPYTEQDAIYWLNLANQGFKNGTHLIFAIRLKPETAFIGGIGLTIEQRFNRAEIGYWIAEPFWNQGYATEATRAIITFGFDHLALHKVTSSHFEQNPASGKVLRKSGLKKEGELQEHIYKNAVYHTLLLYGLTSSAYERQEGLGG